MLKKEKKGPPSQHQAVKENEGGKAEGVFSPKTAKRVKALDEVRAREGEGKGSAAHGQTHTKIISPNASSPASQPVDNNNVLQERLRPSSKLSFNYGKAL